MYKLAALTAAVAAGSIDEMRETAEMFTIKLKQEEDKAAAAAAAAAEGAEEGGAPSESAPVDGGPVDETKEGGEEGAPQEEAEVAPPKELPEVLVERLVVFSSCFDLALLP